MANVGIKFNLIIILLFQFCTFLMLIECRKRQLYINIMKCMFILKTISGRNLVKLYSGMESVCGGLCSGVCS